MHRKLAMQWEAWYLWYGQASTDDNFTPEQKNYILDSSDSSKIDTPALNNTEIMEAFITITASAASTIPFTSANKVPAHKLSRTLGLRLVHLISSDSQVLFILAHGGDIS